MHKQKYDNDDGGLTAIDVTNHGNQ